MIRWGIIGLGNIAMRFINSLANSSQGHLYAVASLTPSKRESFHQQYPGIHMYDSYEKLLDDECIVLFISQRVMLIIINGKGSFRKTQSSFM